MRNELGDASEKTGEIGFDDVSIGSGLDSAPLIRFIGRAGKKENRRVRVEIADLATQLKAINIGQPGSK